MSKHIKVVLDFISVEERLPEADMEKVEMLLNEEKTRPTIYESHRPSWAPFQRRVQGSFRREREAPSCMWLTPYKAYSAGSRSPVTHWAEIPDLTNAEE